MASQLSVGELARRAGVSVRTLQHYDRIGLLPSHRTDTGLRRYAECDLETLQLVRFLQSTGLSLEAVAAALRTTERAALYVAQRDRLGREAVRLSARSRIVDAVLAVLDVVPDASLPADLLSALMDVDATLLAYPGIPFADAGSSSLAGLDEDALMETYLAWRALSVEALLLAENAVEPESVTGRDLGRRWSEFAAAAVAEDAAVADGFASVRRQDGLWPAADRDLRHRTEGFIDRCLAAYSAPPTDDAAALEGGSSSPS